MARKLAGLDGNSALIRVVGVGGAGGNAVNSMIRSGIYGVEFIALNTDAQDLVHSDAPNRLRIGDRSTKGLGAGGDASAARDAALESEAEIRALLDGSDMVFITAGMGGGTGSGAAPVVARIAREMGALTVGVVTTPFAFEGSRRKATAIESAEQMRTAVDALITIPNDRLRDVVGRQTPMLEAFGLADDVLRQGVQGISDIITVPGLINLDFADVRTIMKDAGTALMGIGTAVGDDRAAKALQAALNSPLIGQEISGATGILINFSAGPSLSLAEVSEAAEQITAAADANANIIFGTSLDERRGDEVVVTVVATGFDGSRHRYTGTAVTTPVAESWTSPAPAWSPASYTPVADAMPVEDLDELDDDRQAPLL
jgi:cell division protein FtsZ